jgi:hypothetical protein
MSGNPKSTSKQTDTSAEQAEAPKTNVDTFATELRQGVEKLASLQKSALDIVSQQTAGVNSTLRDSLKGLPDTPGTVLLDLAEQAVQGWVSAQKSVLDLMVQQTEQVVDATKQEGASPTKSLTALNEIVQQSAERAIAAQKTMVEFAQKQSQAVSETVKGQAGLAGTPVASTTDALQRGLNELFKNQREFLEVASKLPRGFVTKT